jgi:cell division GTPase FtsZ
MESVKPKYNRSQMAVEAAVESPLVEATIEVPEVLINVTGGPGYYYGRN